MRMPSVIGRDQGEAERMLREAEAPVAGMVRTSPPGTPPAGPLRVVRQREAGEGVELVVAASVELSGEGDGDEQGVRAGF